MKKASTSLRVQIGLAAGLVAVILVIVLASRFLFETTLRIAIHQGVEGVALKEIIRKFAAIRNISVEVTELPYDKLYDAELKDVSGETKPKFDVIMLDDPWMPALATASYKGKAAGLQKLTFDKCELLSDFVEPILKLCRHPYRNDKVSCDDSFYAFPFVGNSQLFVRKITAPQPKHWDDVLDANYVMRVGSGNQIVTDFMPMLWAMSTESFVFPAKSKGDPKDDAMKDVSLTDAGPAVELLRKLGKRGTANLSIVSQDDFDLAIHLVRNKASMSIIWSAWAMAMRKLPEPYMQQLKDDFTFENVPDGHPAIGAWLLAIPGHAPNETRARDFLSFATGKRQFLEAALAGNPPPLKSILRLDVDDVLDKNSESDSRLKGELKKRFGDLFEVQYSSLVNARPRPRTPHWKEIEDALGKCISGVYESSINVNAALSRAHDAIYAINNDAPIKGFTCFEDRKTPAVHN